MKFANIVSTTKVNVSEDFNVVKNINDVIPDIPTLIIGYDLTNKLFPDFDITKIEINKNLFWTTKKTEKRDKLEEDLRWFTNNVYLKLVKNVNYVYIDPIQQNLTTIKKIIKKIYNLKNIISFFHKDMIYIYGENLIFGVDLKLLRFMQVDTEKIEIKIKSISTVFLEDNDILIEYKKNVGILGEQVKYIPFLFSLRHEKNNFTSLIHLSRKN